MVLLLFKERTNHKSCCCAAINKKCSLSRYNSAGAIDLLYADICLFMMSEIKTGQVPEIKYLVPNTDTNKIIGFLARHLLMYKQSYCAFYLKLHFIFVLVIMLYFIVN